MIKKAKKENLSNLSLLIFNAIQEVANTLTGEDEEEKILKTLDSYIAMDVNRLSYNNSWIYEVQDQTVGLIVAYDSNKIKDFDSPILDYLASKNIFLDAFDKESFEDEFYIDTISVLEEYRGRGIAKDFFIHIERHAKELNYKKLSLLVDIEKDKALRLYEKIGFRKNTILRVSNHNFYHMVKVI